MGKDIIALMIQEYERFTRSERKIEIGRASCRERVYVLV